MSGLLVRLRDKANTVLVVQNKPETIATADRVVDVGSSAGAAGHDRAPGTMHAGAMVGEAGSRPTCATVPTRRPR
jgi:excinuclease UvrABC ATPase subunit